MRKILFLLLALPLVSHAQDAPSLRSAASQYVEALRKLEVDTFLDMTYPKSFTVVSREDVKKGFQNFTNESNGFSMKMLEVAPNFEFQEIKKIGNQQFCVVRFDTGMELKFKEDMSEGAEMMCEMMKQQTGAKKVSFNKERNVFTVEQNATLVGVWDDTTNGKWMFVGTSPGQALDSIFPADIRQKLGI